MRVGDHDHRLGTIEDVGSRAYVEVDDPDGATPKLVVEFDGVTQSVADDDSRVPGDAAGLYDLPVDYEQRACPGTWTTEPGTTRATPEPRAMKCTYVVGHYPYLSDHGWAHEQEPGATWAVVATATTLEAAVVSGTPASRSRCEPGPRAGTGSAVLDGEAANDELATINVESTPSGSFVSRSDVFLVGQDSRSHELTINRTYECDAGGAEERLDLTTTFPVTPEAPAS